MKVPQIIVFFIVFGAMIACQHEKEPQTLINFETTIDEEVMLYGPINRSGLQMDEYAGWFNENYQDYTPNDSIAQLLKGQMDDIEIKIFMGTWCSDSQRDVPAFYRIFDGIDIDPAHEVVAVDRSKKSPSAHVEGYDIEYVPTFIIYRDQKELGRIIEIPETTLEEDLLGLVSGSQ